MEITDTYLPNSILGHSIFYANLRVHPLNKTYGDSLSLGINCGSNMFGEFINILGQRKKELLYHLGKSQKWSFEYRSLAWTYIFTCELSGEKG